MAEYAVEIKELGDKLAGLTLKQAVEIANYLKEAHGIEAAAGGAMMMAAPAAGAAAQPRKKRRPRSTWCSRAPATRRSRSSRSFARPLAWA